MAEGHQGQGKAPPPLEIHRQYEPDQQSILDALRVVLWLPRMPSTLEKPTHGQDSED
jgi:hypothetical protein